MSITIEEWESCKRSERQAKELRESLDTAQNLFLKYKQVTTELTLRLRDAETVFDLIEKGSNSGIFNHLDNIQNEVCMYRVKHKEELIRS